MSTPLAVSAHPAPEVIARQATAAETPRHARALAQLALEHGFAVRTTYTRGTQLGRHGEPGEVVDSIAVRIQRPGLRLAAIWINGAFSTVIAREGFTMNLRLCRAVIKAAPARETHDLRSS